MKRNLLSLCAIATATAGLAAAQSSTQSIDIENGIASFKVGTNIPAIEVSGKTASLKARVKLQHDQTGMKVERIEAWVPPASLKTGMSLRDDHMRKHIFTTAKGDVPDIRFESGEIVCPGVAPGREVNCSIVGTMMIRGVSHPFTLPMRVRQESNGASFRASGDGVVKLSDFGIPQPSQLGVKTSNEVTIHLDLSGKETAYVAAASGGR